MTAQIVSEYRKLATWRAWWWILAVMAVGIAGASGLLTLAVAGSPTANVDVTDASSVAGLYTLAAALGAAFPLALGVIVVTREHSHRTATVTYLAQPRRTTVLWAKVAVAALASVVLGGATLLLSTAAVAAALSSGGAATFLDSPEVLGRLGGTWVALVLWGVIGVGLGSLVDNQVVAIVGVLAFTQLIEPIARLISSSAGASAFGDLLPGGASDALAGGTLTSSAFGVDAAGAAQGALVMVLWAAVLIGLGLVRTARRDLL